MLRHLNLVSPIRPVFLRKANGFHTKLPKIEITQASHKQSVMAAPHVLLIGGNGKVARLLTPMLLKRSWTVTSIIRNADQVPDLQRLGENQGGKLNVLVQSLEDVATDEVAKERIDAVKPDYVVWSAGAGGKGPPERVSPIPTASHS